MNSAPQKTFSNDQKKRAFQLNANHKKLTLKLVEELNSIQIESKIKVRDQKELKHTFPIGFGMFEN